MTVVRLLGRVLLHEWRFCGLNALSAPGRLEGQQLQLQVLQHLVWGVTSTQKATEMSSNGTSQELTAFFAAVASV